MFFKIINSSDVCHGENSVCEICQKAIAVKFKEASTLSLSLHYLTNSQRIVNLPLLVIETAK
jgi:hypothetical protein